MSQKLSNCCGAPEAGNTDLCSKCKEHADWGDHLPDPFTPVVKPAQAKLIPDKHFAGPHGHANWRSHCRKLARELARGRVTEDSPGPQVLFTGDRDIDEAHVRGLGTSPPPFTSHIECIGEWDGAQGIIFARKIDNDGINTINL